MTRRWSRVAGLLAFVYAALLSAHPALAHFSQQGPKLVGSGAVGAGLHL